jgi:hybrid cluster-associated redox disulfide protein
MPRYSADMLIQDVLTSHPHAAAVFERHGLACGSCFAADMETLAAVAHMHDVAVESLIAELDALPEPSEKEGR